MTGVIRPLIWEISDATFLAFRNYTIFEIPADLYEALLVAFKKETVGTYRTVPQKSLEQLIGWFAPNVGFVKWEQSLCGRNFTIHVYYLGDCDRRSAMSELSS